MESHHHNHHKKVSPRIDEISKKLQSEVDVIMASIDEKTIFAEFRQEEIFDIQNGDKRELVRHTLDERIMMQRPVPRYSNAITKIERGTTSAAKKLSRWGRLIHYLFKPLDL